MKRYRGNPAFWTIVILFAILSTLLLALLPQRDGHEVKAYVVHHMVATMDGWMHRCNLPHEVPARIASRIPWSWVGMLSAVAFTFAWMQRRGQRS